MVLDAHSNWYGAGWHVGSVRVGMRVLVQVEPKVWSDTTWSTPGRVCRSAIRWSCWYSPIAFVYSPSVQLPQCAHRYCSSEIGVLSVINHSVGVQGGTRWEIGASGKASHFLTSCLPLRWVNVMLPGVGQIHSFPQSRFEPLVIVAPTR